MLYPELEEKVLSGDIQIGEMLFVVDFRHLDDNVLEKPIRNVKPTKVILASNDDLPLGKRVYYSSLHFRPVGKKDQILASVIAAYDNTGYRGRKGTSINIFKTMEEAKQHYINQCEKVIESIEKTQLLWERKFELMKYDTQNEILKNR